MGSVRGYSIRGCGCWERITCALKGGVKKARNEAACFHGVAKFGRRNLEMVIIISWRLCFPLYLHPSRPGKWL